MINLKMFSTAAATILVLAMAVPTESFAGPRGGKAIGGGGGGMRAGSGLRAGGGASVARYGGGAYRGGGYRGGGGGGFIPGAIAGAVIGGAIASDSYAYYGGPGYAPGYYDDQYSDDVAVAPAPVGGDDAVAYCMQTYRSYDPRSGTYLGFDGMRHPCP